MSEDKHEEAPDASWEPIGPDYITDETRAAVLQRDNYRCRKCGEMDTSKLTLHHIVFRSQSGGHHADNLVTLCWHCHRLLHDKIIDIMVIGGKFFFSDHRHWRNRPRIKYGHRNG